ncbi:chaplin [Streptomyces sp. NPDC059063]|uniref:chaplin n=1 Tax=unclassified Streptomyces TaxID=2593676 RepID=UPI00369E26E0
MRKHSIFAVAALATTVIVTGAGAAVAGPEPSGAHAEGEATNSPGVLSGNLVQVPVDVPVNVCGNSVNVVGALNPASGTECQGK